MYIDKDKAGGCQINDSLLRRMSCGCNDGADAMPAVVHSWGLVDHPLAMVYSPLQEFCELYELDEALKCGTLFKQLDLPFMGESVVKVGCCRG